MFSFQDSLEPGPSSSSSPVMTGGGASADPLLDFQLRPLDARRTWKNVVNKQRFDAILQSHRDHTDQDDVGREVTQALRRAIDRQIASDVTLTPHSTLHFAMQSNTFTHAFQSTIFSVQEFQDGSDRLDTYLQALSDKLNSNEEFTPDTSFTMEMTFIHTPGPGSGNGNRYTAATAAVNGIIKTSEVRIKNDDALCCARAIVTMKAYVDANYNSRDRDYKNLKDGYPDQERRARELHRLAGVPEGPCGIPELKKFQAALPQHRIKVISRAPPYQIIFDGAPFGTKIIRLIKAHDHYDGCNSFQGFMSRSYFCDDCNKGYDHDDFTHHPCDGMGANRVNVKTALTSWRPNKFAVLETIPNLKNSAVSVIENSTVLNVTFTISHEETIAKNAPSVKWSKSVPLVVTSTNCTTKTRKYELALPQRIPTSVDGLNAPIARKKST